MNVTCSHRRSPAIASRVRAAARLCFATFVIAIAAEPSSAVMLVATNGSNLARFDSATPNSVTSVPLTGLQPGETLVGIDYRPATGELYGVGTTNRLYTLNPVTGAATQVGAAGAFTLNGTAFGTDFNPVADRVRQVSNTEQNLRLNPANAGVSGIDAALNPAGSVVAVAYTNNFAGAADTTLYGIDSASGQLVRIGSVGGSPNSPNTGQVTNVGSLGLGSNLNQAIGFDIYSNSIAYAAITFAGQSRLYSINLATGAATSLGIIGTGSVSYNGLAAVLTPPVPVTAYGVTANGVLFRFTTSNPNAATTIGNIGFTPQGLDFRPGTRQLYALRVGASTTQLYTIDLTTAAATPLGAGFPSQGAGYNLLNSTIGFDFSPRTQQADGSVRIRVVSNTGSNLRINSDTGVVTAIDTPLSFGAGDPNVGAPPRVDAIAYTNSAFSTNAAAGTTTLYALDYNADDLLIQNPPNAGVLTTVAQGLTLFDQTVSFDIYTDPDSTNDGIAGDHGFAVIRRQGETTSLLHDVDLATGAVINGRTVGGGLDFVGGFAVQPSAGKFRLSATTYSVNEGAGLATVTVERVNGSIGAASVNIATIIGSADPGVDYFSTSTTLNFASGETSKTFSVPVTDDAAVEGDETFGVLLGAVTGGAFTTSPTSAVITIVDNDIPAIALSSQANFSDNDTPPGQTVRVGSKVTFSYVVTNTGSVPLSNIVVTDDNGTSGDPSDDFTAAFQNGDANGNNLLDPNETWTFTADRIAAAGQFTNLSTATGKPPGNAPNVSATDAESFFGAVATVLANISTRLRVETGDRIMIGGFIITGNEDKKVIIRALGPSLGVPGLLENPALEVYNSEGGLIAQNDNWQDAPNRQSIIDTTIAPSNDAEAAFVGTLAPGAYTALVFGAGETTGIGLVEVYDLDQTIDAELGNIATRGFVQTGDDVLIGGLIVTGDAQLKILVRAIGPSLNIGSKLADPTLELVNANGDTLLANDNWRDTQEADIAATSIAPTDDLESAILTTVSAANYTAIVRGRDGSTGIGLVEIYGLK